MGVLKFKLNFEFGLGKGFAPTRLIIPVFILLIDQQKSTKFLIQNIGQSGDGSRDD